MSSENTEKKFECIKDCSQCCIEREYYPSKKFGKIGVLILPDEKEKIEYYAKREGLDVLILPRIGISHEETDGPTEILAYQMMGKDADGNTCKFLDIESDKKSPHGGYQCKIYENRPLACNAYPVIETNPIDLDSKCKFCQECGVATLNLNYELESLIQIKTKMTTQAPFVWRYATGVGKPFDKTEIKTGWILES